MADNSTTKSGAPETTGKMSEFWNGVSDFLETDSRGIGRKSKTLYELKNGHKPVTTYLEIPTPAWYPDSLLRSIKRNNYIKMVNESSILGTANSISSANNGTSLDFYKEDASDAITGLVKNAAKSIASTVSNQIISITSKVDSILDGIDSVFGGSSSSDSSSDVSEEPFLSSQPYLSIYGIHMTESLRDLLSSISSAMSIVSAKFSSETMGRIKEHLKKFEIDKIYDDLNGGALVESLSEKAYNTIVNFVGGKDKIDAIIEDNKKQKKDTSKLSALMIALFENEDFRMHGIAETLLDSVITGTYTMKCKVPFFGESASRSTVIKSYGDDGFSGLGDLTKASGELGKWIRQSTGLNLIWTNPIEWSPKSATTFTPAILNFDIFNDTIEHALLNLGFILSFGATTKAVTDAIFIRSPYMYNITIPSGFRYKYCVCNFDVYPKGKIRRLFDPSKGVSFSNLIKETIGREVNPRAIEYVPDAYNVKMTFTSKLPDLWNYIDSYINFNLKNDDIRLGDRIQTKLATLMDAWDKANKTDDKKSTK